jgi:hypothetical protein
MGENESSILSTVLTLCLLTFLLFPQWWNYSPVDTKGLMYTNYLSKKEQELDSEAYQR